jgi:hypothetical protein
VEFLVIAVMLAAFVVPPVVASGIGVRAHQPSTAFWVAWVSTPVMALAIAIVFEIFLHARSGGLTLLTLPAVGVGTGLLAGVVATLIVKQSGRHDNRSDAG